MMLIGENPYIGIYLFVGIGMFGELHYISNTGILKIERIQMNIILTPRKSLNKAYLKQKPLRADIDSFKENLKKLIISVNDTESEEFHKNLLSDFLKNTYYSPNHSINTKGRNDLVIHNGSSASSSVGVLIEAKKPTNKVPGQDNWLFPNPQVKIVFGGNIRIRGLQAMFMADSWEIFSSGLDFIPFFEFTPYRWGWIPVSNFEQGSKFRNIFEKLLEISK